MKRKNILILFILVVNIFVLTFPTLHIEALAGQWSANGKNIYYNDGNIGIGTNVPANDLDIGSNTSNNSNLRLNSGINYQPEIKFSTGGIQRWMISKPVNSTDLRFFDGEIDSLSLGDKASGIKLLIKNNTNNQTFLAFNNTIDGSLYRFHSSFDNKMLTMGIKDGTTGAEHWDVISFIRNGDITMGTNSDNVNLYVNGTIKTKELRVSSAGWADYVFEPNYPLASLKEVEDYITKNNHLKNIPSADDIEQNGVSIGEMQKMQMEKIEELTLYMIQQDKKIDELESRLLALESYFGMN